MVTSPGPSRTFTDSLERMRTLQNREVSDPRINPDCYSILFEHGQRTQRAVVFMHGITSSPPQFRELGALFYSRGYNVVIPRMPRHGYRDRMSNDHARLTEAEFETYVVEAVDLGRGLGDHLTVAGLSVSGVLAAWCAQTRSDVDQAVLMATAFAPHRVPVPLIRLLTGILKRLPNMFVLWNFGHKAWQGPICGYPRFATRAMAQSFQIGLNVYDAAKHQPPAARSILAITNPRDMAVNNAATAALVRRWRAHGNANVREYQFGPELGTLHDFVGPYQPNAQTEYVYPILLKLIDSESQVPA